VPTRKADAVWEGSLEKGKGRVKWGAYEGNYSFASRFEAGPGTNPEELIAAAHAGCYSMALSGMLGGAGFAPKRIRTQAEVHLEKAPDHWTITHIDLITEAEVPGLDEKTFLAKAQEAKAGCPVSRALAAVQINLKAKLVG
jgi:osmotically inducible protein OsmC